MLRVPIRVGISGVPDGLLRVFPEELAKPAHALALHDPVRIDPRGKVGDVGDVAADDNRGRRLVLADQLAHAFDFQHVGGDAAYSHDVVAAVTDFFHEAVQGRKVEQGTGCSDVRLDEHQSPGTVEHPQRKRTFYPSDLVVVQFHRVDSPAAIFVILSVGSEDARQQHPGSAAQRMGHCETQTGGVRFAGGSCGFHGFCFALVSARNILSEYPTATRLKRRLVEATFRWPISFECGEISRGNSLKRQDHAGEVWS